ncbi:MAG TPA: zinc ribbon domain-containing protein [Solirubrobacterales bacterium]|nr:zinc ribbon domain-containing protein [Solirubrobacterales bacterium]
MPLAIFGITNDGLNLAATLFLLMLVVLWLALIVYTYLDARRRISDPFLVACATVASFFPYIGTAVYAIVRPPEFLEDAHERELEIKAAELRVRQLREQSCPHCEFPIERNYLRCPSCQRRLKDPCPTCNKPVDPRWDLCPYCETNLGGGGGGGERPRRKQRRDPEERQAQPRQAQSRQSEPPPRRRKAPPEAQEGAQPTQEQRSPRREPDPDPRQA